MPLPPAFEDRNGLEQVAGPVLITMIFGLICGLALGWHEVAYWALAGPLALFGGFLGGMEHRGADEGLVRGAVCGLLFGSFVLLGLEITNNEPTAHIGEPQVGLVFVTTIAGAIVGALGGAYRVKRERELAAGPPVTG